MTSNESVYVPSCYYGIVNCEVISFTLLKYMKSDTKEKLTFSLNCILYHGICSATRGDWGQFVVQFSKLEKHGVTARAVSLE